MSVSRRALFPVAGVGALGLVQGTEAAEIDPTSFGLNVKLRMDFAGQWTVPVVAWENMKGWRPGNALMYRDVQLMDFLRQVEVACGIDRGQSSLKDVPLVKDADLRDDTIMMLMRDRNGEVRSIVILNVTKMELGALEVQAKNAATILRHEMMPLA